MISSIWCSRAGVLQNIRKVFSARPRQIATARTCSADLLKRMISAGQIWRLCTAPVADSGGVMNSTTGFDFVDADLARFIPAAAMIKLY